MIKSISSRGEAAVNLQTCARDESRFGTGEVNAVTLDD